MYVVSYFYGHRSQGEENMDFDTEIKVFLAYAAGVLAVYLMGRFLLTPLKITLRLLISSLAGGAALFLINLLGRNTGIFVPLNPLTAVFAGSSGHTGNCGDDFVFLGKVSFLIQQIIKNEKISYSIDI